LDDNRERGKLVAHMVEKLDRRYAQSITPGFDELWVSEKNAWKGAQCYRGHTEDPGNRPLP